MDAAQRKATADNIRQFVAQGKIEDAIKKLVQFSEIMGGDYQDEALTLSANWSQLQVERRNQLVSASEAGVRQNRLLDQLLEMTRAMEKQVTPPHIEKEKAKEVPAPEEKEDTNGSRVRLFGLIFGAIFLIAVALILIIINSGKEEDICEQILEQAEQSFQQKRYQEAKSSYEFLIDLNCDRFFVTQSQLGLKKIADLSASLEETVEETVESEDLPEPAVAESEQQPDSLTEQQVPKSPPAEEEKVTSPPPAAANEGAAGLELQEQGRAPLLSIDTTQLIRATEILQMVQSGAEDTEVWKSIKQYKAQQKQLGKAINPEVLEVGERIHQRIRAEMVKEVKEVRAQSGVKGVIKLYQEKESFKNKLQLLDEDDKKALREADRKAEGE